MGHQAFEMTQHTLLWSLDLEKQIIGLPVRQNDYSHTAYIHVYIRSVAPLVQWQFHVLTMIGLDPQNYIQLCIASIK